MQLMALRRAGCLLCALFESDSEYEWLLLIKTSLSYKLNPTTIGTFSCQNGMVEVFGLTKQFLTVEKTGSQMICCLV